LKSGVPPGLAHHVVQATAEGGKLAEPVDRPWWASLRAMRGGEASQTFGGAGATAAA